MRRLRQESGQAFVFLVLFLPVLLGIAAAVLDVGSWYRAQRQLQATVDAAALAGAQALPEDTLRARQLAAEYADKNGGIPDGEVRFESQLRSNDTIVISGTGPAPGFFSRVVGIDSVQVAANGTARAATPDEARWAAPIAVDEQHPLLQCSPAPCFEQPTELELEKTGPGAFRLVNIDGSRGGTGPSTLAEWIETGYDGNMPLGWYYSDPGAKFNSSEVRSALDSRLETEMLFPVYRETRGQGANFEYEIVAWAGYHLTGYEIQGSKKNKLFGWFTRVVWQGIQSQSASGPDYGVRVIALIG